MFLVKRHTYVRNLLPHVKSIVANGTETPVRILDVGCNRYKITSNATSLDVDPSVKPDSVGSCLAMPFLNETFDTVTALEVIEHFTWNDQVRFLSEVHRVLKPRGQFIVSTPNISEVTRKLHRWLFWVTHMVYAPKDVHAHVGELTHLQLKMLLVSHQFKVLSEKAFSFFNYVVDCERA